MSFIGDMFGKGKPEDDDDDKPSIGVTSQEDLMDAFREGERRSADYMQGLIERGAEYIEQGKAMEGTLFIFTAVLRTVGVAKQSVYKSQKKHGNKSPVVQMWNLLQRVLTAENIDEDGGRKVLKEWLKNPDSGLMGDLDDE